MSEIDAGEARVACSTEDVSEDSPEVTEIDGVKVAIFYADDEYFAVQNTCPHQGGPLGAGKVEDNCVYCPWHGWQFDLESGEHVHGKETAQTYEVRVKKDDIYVVTPEQDSI